MEKLKRIVEWTKLKLRIEAAASPGVYFRERESWWVSIGSNIGFEQDGKNQKFERPVLIVNKFGQDSFWGIPMSSKEKYGRFYLKVDYRGTKYSILLSQLKLMSSKRLARKLRTLSKAEFAECRERIKRLL